MPNWWRRIFVINEDERLLINSDVENLVNYGTNVNGYATINSAPEGDNELIQALSNSDLLNVNNQALVHWTSLMQRILPSYNQSVQLPVTSYCKKYFLIFIRTLAGLSLICTIAWAIMGTDLVSKWNNMLIVFAGMFTTYIGFKIGFSNWEDAGLSPFPPRYHQGNTVVPPAFVLTTKPSEALPTNWLSVNAMQAPSAETSKPLVAPLASTRASTSFHCRDASTINNQNVNSTNPSEHSSRTRAQTI